MKTKLVAVIALIFCAFMAEASKVEGNGNIITKEISVDNYSEIELGGNIEYSGNNFCQRCFSAAGRSYQCYLFSRMNCQV